MSKHVTRMTIEDAEHLSREQIDEIIASYPPHERDARVKGLPARGTGLVFPISEVRITVEPFEIPKYFAQIGGIDFGWTHPTAAVRLAHDRDTDTVYITHEYRVKEQPPLIHAAALKPWGKIPFSWPHDGYGKSGKYGAKPGVAVKDEYTEHGLEMLHKHAQFESGSNAVEPGLMEMLERMMTDRLKVFSWCTKWLQEFRDYNRVDGIPVDEHEDLICATRYAIMNLRDAEVIKPKDNRDKYARAASRAVTATADGQHEERMMHYMTLEDLTSILEDAGGALPIEQDEVPASYVMELIRLSVECGEHYMRKAWEAEREDFVSAIRDAREPEFDPPLEVYRLFRWWLDQGAPDVTSNEAVRAQKSNEIAIKAIGEAETIEDVKRILAAAAEDKVVG